MFISKIKLSGFKSFSDETVLNFDYSLNGIIGPNGSGKSNIVEAIKWVMGENSSKSLRGSGMNDIIFSGSTTKASKNIASVTLFLKIDSKDISSSSKKYINSGNIEVERQIIRDTGSTYRINGKEVRAKDVQFLFADLSSGSRATNIIDQGSIGNLITQKPSERRRILDEAAGISGISARKIESKNKLEATKRNLSRLADILLDNKERLSKLKKQADIALKFKEANERIGKLNRDIVFAKLQKAFKNSNNIKRNLEENSKILSEKLNLLSKIEVKKRETETMLENLNNESREINQENLNKLNTIKQTNLQLENNIKQLESLKNLKEQIKKNDDFQKEILENSLSRLKVLEEELIKFKKIENTEVFLNSENEYKKIHNQFIESSRMLDDNSLKLLSKKEIVSNKEYQKTLLLSKYDDIENECETIRKSIIQKENFYKNNNYFLDIEKIKIKVKNKNVDIKSQINKDKKKLEEYNVAAISLKAEFDKIIFQENEQNLKVYELNNQVSVYTSLGFKNTKKNIIKNIIIDSEYKLAFYLALGDGIEASSDKNAPVAWNNPTNNSVYPLPEGIICANKYVKGPKEIRLFLSQVGIVNNNEEGYRYQKELKPGQIIVSKEGSLWRWDGLIIKDGMQTITHKRIISTTKLIELEKKLKSENIKSKKLSNIKKQLNKKHQHLEIEIKKIIKKNNLSENLLMSNNEKLVEIEKELLLKKNKKELDLEEINKERLLLEEKTIEGSKLKKEIKLLKDFITKESGEIVNIKKVVSTKNKENNILKDRYENFRIQFEINKKQKDAETIRKEKIEEEIFATKKQIKNTEYTLLALKDDSKKADYEESIILKKPDDSEKKILDVEKSIELNKIKLRETDIHINKNKSELETIVDRHNKFKVRIDSLKEDAIRKEAQLEQLNDYLKTEEERIVTDLRISKDEIKSSINKFDYSNIDIKNSEMLLRNLKYKVDNIDDINLTAEKELKELENKINTVLIEEKDLNNAAKKLEKAIEELNKEARNRVLNTFASINSTFSELFKKLFDGGKAYLELIESEDPLEAGLELLVSPPGKKLQRISLLSGGEKALASLALIFSTFINRQTPICILDEVDAPLDDFNVERFCSLLKETTKITNKKFLVITHNKITMGYMNKVYGVTMNEPGISKLVSVNLDKIDSEFAAE
ncbi:MAG: chromosome segregation protein SMC [Pelagibacterales bacterium]|nr:chromosome segregation protein SMC [Pelagibacterales bacterium]